MCKVMFAMERETKNTVRFTEVLQGKMTNPVVGTVYIQKDALKAKGWEEGKGIVLDISLTEEINTEGATTAAEKNAATIAKYKERQENTKKKTTVKKAAVKKTAVKAEAAGETKPKVKRGRPAKKTA